MVHGLQDLTACEDQEDVYHVLKEACDVTPACEEPENLYHIL